MNHRERVMAAIHHETPDRLPVDMGGMRSTGIMALTYADLKDHLGITEGDTYIFDTMQQLAHVEAPIRERLGCDVMILNTSSEAFPETCSFSASAYGKFGAIHSVPIGDPEFIGGAERILHIFREMVQTKKPPMDYDDFIEPIAVIEAGQLAQKNGNRVYVKDVLETAHSEKTPMSPSTPFRLAGS